MPCEGYKMTDLGELPNDWKIQKLHDILDGVIDFRGKTPKKLGMDWGGGDIPALSANNVEMGKINSDKETYYGSEKLYKRWMTNGDTERGDIVITMEAPLGNIAAIPDNKRYILSQRVLLFKTKYDSVLNNFLKHQLMGYSFQSQLMTNATGTTAKGIQQKRLVRLLLAIPPLPEQHRIEEILSTMDETIEHTEALIEKYRNIKKGLMTDLLTRGIDEGGRIRSEETHRFKDSPLGRMPEEWGVDVLSNLTNKIIDGTHYTPNYTDYGVPFLRVTDIQNKTINFKRLKFISPNEHMELIKRCRPEKDDILYSKNGTIGIGKIIDWDWEFSIFVSLCLIKTKPDNIRTDYLFYILDSDIIKKQIRIRTKQMTVMNLHLEEIKEFQIPMPSPKEQCLIVKILTASDERIEKEELYIDKLLQLKKGLMQDLLTGRVRVKVPQEAEA